MADIRNLLALRGNTGYLPNKKCIKMGSQGLFVRTPKFTASECTGPDTHHIFQNYIVLSLQL